jgi:hypothetical protein
MHPQLNGLLLIQKHRCLFPLFRLNMNMNISASSESQRCLDQDFGLLEYSESWNSCGALKYPKFSEQGNIMLGEVAYECTKQIHNQLDAIHN